MRSKGRIFLGVLSLTLLGAGAFVYLLLSDQTRADRATHFDHTMAELRRGNYFAWGQMELWLDRLTPTEEFEFREASFHYSQSNLVFHIIGVAWPPKDGSVMIREWSLWMKGAVGMDDCALRYDRVYAPFNHDLRISRGDSYFRAMDQQITDKIGPAAAAAIIAAVPAHAQ